MWHRGEPRNKQTHTQVCTDVVACWWREQKHLDIGALAPAGHNMPATTCIGIAGGLSPTHPGRVTHTSCPTLAAAAFGREADMLQRRA